MSKLKGGRSSLVCALVILGIGMVRPLPVWAPLRGHRRFTELLRRANLPDPAGR